MNRIIGARNAHGRTQVGGFYKTRGNPSFARPPDKTHRYRPPLAAQEPQVFTYRKIGIAKEVFHDDLVHPQAEARTPPDIGETGLPANLESASSP